MSQLLNLTVGFLFERRSIRNMRRLTERIPDFQEPYRPPGLRECTTVIANSSLHNVLELLAAYEDTGLEPNEIEELKERLIVSRT